MVLSALAALVVALLGSVYCSPGPPAGDHQRISVSSQQTAGDDFSVAAISTDHRVAASRRGAPVPQEGRFLVDVLVHDEQPSPTSVAESEARPGTDSQ